MQLDQRSDCVVAGISGCVNKYLESNRLVHLDILERFIIFAHEDISHLIRLYCKEWEKWLLIMN